MYKITVEQTVIHKRNNGETWSSEECLEGMTASFETCESIMGIITEAFPNATVTISTTNIKEDE